MREILFRGKRCDNGEWIEGDLRQDKDLETLYIFGWNYSVDENGLQRETFEYMVKPETVGQYTGLTDKNGTRIFEGDILSAEWLNKTITGVVTYSDLQASFALLKDNEYFWFEDDIYCNSYEVVGNIHGNPELIETN